MLPEGDFGELSPNQRWAVQAIQRNCRRLRSLIEDMLTLAKIENGELGLAIEPTDVSSLMDDVRTAAAPMAAGERIDMRFEVASSRRRFSGTDPRWSGRS